MVKGDDSNHEWYGLPAPCVERCAIYFASECVDVLFICKFSTDIHEFEHQLPNYDNDKMTGKDRKAPLEHSTINSWETTLEFTQTEKSQQ